MADQLTLSEFTPYRIVVLGRRMSEALARAYAGENLTIPEWRVLAVVSQAPEMAARDVVLRTPMDKMAVSRAAASLEEKGLLVRTPRPNDRRVSTIRLTDKGRRIFDKIAGVALAYERGVFEGMTAAEKARFSELLAKLERGVGEDVDADAAGEPEHA